MRRRPNCGTKCLPCKNTLEKQIVATPEVVDRDVWGIAVAGEVTVGDASLAVRGGFICGTRHIELAEALGSDAEILAGVICQYYEKPVQIPDEILVPARLENASMIEEWIFETKASKARIFRPRRGDRRELVRRADENAAKALQDFLAARQSTAQLLVGLQKKLGLRSRPDRIECFDTSNIMGAEPVARHGGFRKRSAQPGPLSALPCPDGFPAGRLLCHGGNPAPTIWPKPVV